MRHLLKLVGAIFIIVVLPYSCVYHQITHLNDEELEWVTNRYEGEILYFKAQNGLSDTVTIKEIMIQNSLDPINWGYFNTGSEDYIAFAYVRYSVSYNENKGGILQIEKRSKDGPICFSSVLIEGWVYDIPLDTTSLQIDGININDIMFFENEKSDSNVVKSYSWSKKYGLVQYSLQDGTIFSRISVNAQKYGWNMAQKEIRKFQYTRKSIFNKRIFR